MSPDNDPNPALSLRRHLIIGLGAAFVLVFVIGGWASLARLSGAVIAQGLLVVNSNVKKVQHPTGGVVSELRVRDGDSVHAGDILVRLDETQTKANLGIVSKSLDELAAREARDNAELENADSVRFSDELLSRAEDTQVSAAMLGERKLFATRLAARDGQKTQLREEIAGLEVQRDARVSQIEWIQKELKGVRELWAKDLTPYSRLTALEREAARLEGERGQLISSIAQTKEKILQVDQDMRAEVGKDIADIRGKQVELMERKIAAQDQLARVDIRAPRDGIVYQSTVHTVGGVISAGEQIMLVAPAGDVLMVEAKLRPEDIDQVRVDQKAVLHFAAFNQRTTPELDGQVSMVSPDVSQDQKSGAYFYTVRIAIPETEIAKLDSLKLVAGMPAEAFIQTADRTALAYLMRPLHDQIARAFKEK
jgi:HlyD family secretion protein